MSLHSFSHDSWHILAATKGFAQNVSAWRNWTKIIHHSMIHKYDSILAHVSSLSSVIIAHCEYYCTPMWWPHPTPEWGQPASLVTTLVPLCTPLSLLCSQSIPSTQLGSCCPQLHVIINKPWLSFPRRCFRLWWLTQGTWLQGSSDNWIPVITIW